MGGRNEDALLPRPGNVLSLCLVCSASLAMVLGLGVVPAALCPVCGQLWGGPGGRMAWLWLDWAVLHGGLVEPSF